MTFDLGPHKFAALWAKIFPEDAHYFVLPAEHRSTCSDCPQIAAANFHPVYRCCTYIPRLPNFLYGAGLKDPATKARLVAVTKRHMGTPEGLVASPFMQRRSANVSAAGDYGKDAGVVCPFLQMETGLCGIYSYRNSVCATYFCISDLGKAGQEFWEKLQSLMGQLETALSQWCMASLGIDPANTMGVLNSFDVESHLKDFDRDIVQGSSTTSSTASSIDLSAWPPDIYRQLWGKWFGREIDYYTACVDLLEQYQGDLFEIASGVELLNPDIFERNLRNTLQPEAQIVLDQEVPIGRAMPISDLWYMVQLAYRNLRVSASVSTSIPPSGISGKV